MSERAKRSISQTDVKKTRRAYESARNLGSHFAGNLAVNAFPISRKASCACGGGCPSCQAKSNDLKVSQPNDAAEIEADRMADTVMRMTNGDESPPPRVSETAVSQIQAKSEGQGGGSPVSGKIGERIEASRGGGSGLDDKTRGFMESRIGADLGGVRIHTGSEAAGLNRELNSRAFTLGSDIYFNEGQFKPDSHKGKHLLAHELIHVVQQNNPLYSTGRKIHRNGAESATEQTPEQPPPTTPAATEEKTITIVIVLEKDCTAMPLKEFKDFVQESVLTQVFGFDPVTSAEEQLEHKYPFSKFNEDSPRTKGARRPIAINKHFYRMVLVNKYGPDDPRIEQLVQANFGKGAAPLTGEGLKENTKQMLLEDIKSQLTPLEREFLRSKLKTKTGTADESLKSYRKILENLKRYKKELGWYEFLKAKLSPVEYYRAMAKEFLKTERLFHLIYTRRELAPLFDPLGPAKRNQSLYDQYPWLKGEEELMRKDLLSPQWPKEYENNLTTELELAGFSSAGEYEDFLKMFAHSFYGVVALKISQQLDVNEEIVKKEKAFYTDHGVAPFAQIFGQFKPEYEQIDAEAKSNRSHFSNLPDGTKKYNEKVEELRERETALDKRVKQVREVNKVGYPILEDKDLTNRQLVLQSPPNLKKTLISLSDTRLGYIESSRRDLAKEPENFVVFVAEGKYVESAKKELGIDSGSLENFMIDGRIAEVEFYQELKDRAVLALSIGLFLLTLPFSGTAAVIASIPGFALGIFATAEEFEEYQVRKAAAGTSFDPAAALSNDDPSLTWLVIGLVGTALEGAVLFRSFTKLAKSIHLKNGLPEKEFVAELEQVLLKEKPDIDPEILENLIGQVDNKVDEATELKTAFNDAVEEYKTVKDPERQPVKKIKVPVVLLPSPSLQKLDAIGEMMYWAIRRGIKTTDEFLLEAKITGVEKELLEKTYTRALAKFQGKRAPSKTAYQEFVLDMYKDFGHEIREFFVRNRITNTGARMKAIKQPDGSFKFLELEDMTENAELVMGDMKKGGDDLQLGRNETEKIKDFSQVHSLGAPIKILSDLPALNAILTEVEKIRKPVTALRRKARQLSSDLDVLKAKGADAAAVTRLEDMLADAQQQLSDTGTQLMSKADELSKEASLITDAEQQSELLQKAADLRSEGKLLGYHIRVQDAINLRSKLRKALRTAELFGNNALYYKAHHIIPVELIEQSALLRKAIEEGFEFHGMPNGINLSQFSSKFSTENFVIQLLENGKKASVKVNGKLVGQADVIDKGGGITAFVQKEGVAEKELARLTYSKQLKGDGSVIESGTIELTDASGTVSQILRESPFGAHAGHPKYNAAIEKMLDQIELEYSMEMESGQALEKINKLAKQIKDLIMAAKDTPNFKIDELF